MPLNFYESPLQTVEQIIRDLIAVDTPQKFKRERTDIVKNEREIKRLGIPIKKSQTLQI